MSQSDDPKPETLLGGGLTDFFQSGAPSASVPPLSDDLIPPPSLSLTSNKSQTLAFFRDLRRAASRGTPFHVRFERIESLSAAAALMLAAEIHTLSLAAKGKLQIRGLTTWQRPVQKLMVQMGFFSLLDINDTKLRKGLDDISLPFLFVKVWSNVLAEGRDLTAFHDALDRQKIADHFPARVAKMLYTGISEAMVNVIHHAYPPDFSLPHRPHPGRRWWMSASYNLAQKRLRVTFLDQGIGIPGSLRSNLPEWVLNRIKYRRHYIPQAPDGSLILHAFGARLTRHEKPHRGKGLHQIRQVIDEKTGSELRVWSNRGDFRYANRDYTGREPRFIVEPDHEISIEGTLIQWEFDFAQMSQ